MTDPIILKNVRLSYPNLKPLDDKLGQRIARQWSGGFTAQMPPHVAARWAESFGQDPTPLLVGHDPQKLLPSPERLERERLAWYDNLTKLFTQRDVTNAMLSVYIDFDKPSGVALPLPMIPPGDEIKLFRERERAFEHKVAIISTDADYATIEARLMASLANPSVRCIVLDIDSVGGDILSPRNYQAEMYALGALENMKQPVETAAGIRDKSYLKHDPSKKHKRRKRK